MENVTVLMSTYNGEKYLEEQIESILNQTYKNVLIYVRDDGSTDNTINILKKYEKKGKITWYSGENLKPAYSFMDLIYSAPNSDYYALCDQDDIWLEDKLQIAISKLNEHKENIPLLYYGNPRLVDNNLNLLNNTKSSFEHMLKFNEAIINSNATGCTMVFNKKLMSLLKSKKPNYIIMHDAWIHKLCLAVDGQVIFDDDVHILYRQHSNNVVGISSSFLQKISKKILRLKLDKNKKLRTMQSLNECYRDYISKDNREICDLIVNYDKKILNKIKIIFNNKVKTKYFHRNLFFKFLILFNLY